MGCCRLTNRRGGRLLGIVAAAAVATTGVAAQAPPPGPATTVQGRDVVPHAVTVRGMTVVGSAWRANNTPIPHARIRLRNIVTGKIEAITQADDEGAFLFEKVRVGSYLVELVSDDDGKVLAVSHAFTVLDGE